MAETALQELFYSHKGNLIHKWEHYLDIYETHFSRFRNKELAMLEIGISHGGSLQLWHKYFGTGLNLYAIDINEQCKKFETENTRILIGSQQDQAFLVQTKAALPELDIILDDGGHTMLQQKMTFETLFLQLKEGGLFVVEDTHTSYWEEYHGGYRKKGSFIEYSKNLVDSLYTHHMKKQYSSMTVNDISKHINSITFYDSIVIFEKKKRPLPTHIQVGEEQIKSYTPTELKKKSLLSRIVEKFTNTNNTYEKNFKGKISPNK